MLLQWWSTCVFISAKLYHFTFWGTSCLRAFQEGDINEFNLNLKESKQVWVLIVAYWIKVFWSLFYNLIFCSSQELLFSIYHSSEESTEFIHSTIVKLQVCDFQWFAVYLHFDKAFWHLCLSGAVIVIM